MDIATLVGLIMGFGAVIGGQLLEGGHLSALLQPTAAVIVLGGTIGATLVSFPVQDLVEMQIFFREFKDQLEKYLNIHRNLWEEISDIKERKLLRGSEIEPIRAKLDSYQKTISLIRKILDNKTISERERETGRIFYP